MTENDKRAIEEMARIICGNNRDCRDCGHNSAVRECGCLFYAKRIYGQGYRKQTEWISVSERLPDEELQELKANDPEMTFRCLTARISDFGEGATYVYQAFYDEKHGKKRFVNGNGVDITASVTHWRPLPEPPEMKGVSHD